MTKNKIDNQVLEDRLMKNSEVAVLMAIKTKNNRITFFIFNRLCVLLYIRSGHWRVKNQIVDH
jgi:hypothetical protein